jgi:tetratricopeptide (TPR) repeat protein
MRRICFPTRRRDFELPVRRMPHAALARLTCLAVVAALVAAGAAQDRSRARAIFDRAVADFQGGRIAESVAGFDTLARLLPDDAPQLWQRGIALYYAGRYRDCRAQFESHRAVNPDDVENAAWHFLCVARDESPQRAKGALLPVGPDRRVPMHEIYRMFAGALEPARVLEAAGTDAAAEFYAHLYVGLYLDALGDHAGASKHIRTAAADRYAAAGGYMHGVARVHLSHRRAVERRIR